jgi:hypothetical protein
MSELPKQYILKKKLLIGDESLLPPSNLFSLAQDKSIISSAYSISDPSKAVGLATLSANAVARMRMNNNIMRTDSLSFVIGNVSGMQSDPSEVDVQRETEGADDVAHLDINGVHFLYAWP